LHFAASFLRDERTVEVQAQLSCEIDDETFCPDGRTNRFNLRTVSTSVTFRGIDASIQIAAPRMGNQTHDEHLIPADEQWSSRREQLASSGRCPIETN
jgi:hypothetical protein